MVSADVRLPTSQRGPLGGLLRRLLLALALIAIVALTAYLGREGYRDGDEMGMSLLDAVYYATVSITTTGYGDITPVTDAARLCTTLIVTPARVLFLVLLVGTTLEVLAQRTRLAYREQLWRRGLDRHTIICGYGIKGRAAVETLRADAGGGELVIIDPRPDVVDEATRRGLVGVVGDASTSNALLAAGIERAAAVVVAPDRDDTAVLITLTARELNPGASIVAAVRDAENAHLLEQSGADSVITSSAAAGRLLGHAVRNPRVVQVLEDLLSFGKGLDIVESEVPAEQVGRPLREMPSTSPVIGISRRGQVLRFDDARTERLEEGDRIVFLASNA